MKRRTERRPALRVPHRYEWLWEPLAGDAAFILRSMFGAKAVYLDGKLMLCFIARDEPWRGVLVGTDRSHHASLQAEFSELVPHKILPKWLYLPESADRFESVAAALVGLARQRDARLGVLPSARRRKVRVARAGVKAKRTKRR
jgi:hypothetical protein